MIGLGALLASLTLTISPAKAEVTLGEAIELHVTLDWRSEGRPDIVPVRSPELVVDARSLALAVTQSGPTWKYSRRLDREPAEALLAQGDKRHATVSWTPVRTGEVLIQATYAGGDTPPSQPAKVVVKASKDGATELGWRLETSKGVMTARFLPEAAPNHVAHMAGLIAQGFFDGTAFHRVLKGFMAQGGDPTSKTDPANAGEGGPGYTLPAEFSKDPGFSHTLGRISTARDDNPDTGGSQFFICFDGATRLDGKYTVFGELADDASRETLRKIEAIGAKKDPEKPSEYVKIVKATLVPLAPTESGKNTK